MQIQEIKDKQTWNSFVLGFTPNTFLQAWEWGQLQEADGEKVLRLGIFDGERQIGAAQWILIHAKRGNFFLCPHGPLFATEQETLKALPDLVNYMRTIAQQEQAVAVRIAPLIPTSQIATRTFQDLKFRPAPLHIHAELTWVLDIQPTEEQLLQEMRKTTRHAIRKAEKEGVTIDIQPSLDALDRFWPLYEQTRSRHEFVPFSKDFLKKQIEAFLPSNGVFLIFAKYQGNDVAGAILMHFGDTVFYHHGASTKLPSSVPAAQLLQWGAIREAKQRGAKRYNFWGIAPEDQPNHPFAGITIFKKGFGGYSIDYIHAQDLALSPKYWKLWLIEMYRKYRRGF